LVLDLGLLSGEKYATKLHLLNLFWWCLSHVNERKERWMSCDSVPFILMRSDTNKMTISLASLVIFTIIEVVVIFY
jgi:hypothetical protein